jgi:DMSO/TMAO reductase YedYZ molybdopterin-dependent catalytic subunit
MMFKLNKTTITGTAIIIALIAVSIVFLVIEGNRPPPATPLGNVEVREYEGQALSSIDDFRENSIRGPQHVDVNEYHLEVDGLVSRAVRYTYDEVVDKFASYSKVVRLKCVEGWSVDILWQGVLVRDILAQARVQPEARVVIFQAYDGYKTSFPIEYFTENNILMAYGMNGVPLPAERGFPFQLVAESKWGYKWIKWVTRIELSDNTDYRGYWESAGFSNDGDVNGPMTEP